MASESEVEAPSTLPRGAYAPSKPTDSRSPCPAVNALANHGYLNRDGRNIRAKDLHSALGELGLGSLLGSAFTHPPFLEVAGKDAPEPSGLWSMLRNPFSYFFQRFAMRNPGQKDPEGFPCLNLEQLARHNAVEHDVSLSRLDYAQGDNITRQPELIKEMLSASSDGSTLSLADLVSLRKKRYAQQKANNPVLDYGSLQQELGCGEVALILKILGDGSTVPTSYMKAFFEEERLPTEEGWSKRWWTLGIIELVTMTRKVKGLVGSIPENAEASS